LAIDLVIVTPEGQAYSGEVEQVVLPGSEGDFGVLAEHERTLAPLQHGAVEIKTAAGSEWAAISNGFAEVAAERVVVLADSCVLAAAVDKTAVEADMKPKPNSMASPTPKKTLRSVPALAKRFVSAKCASRLRRSSSFLLSFVGGGGFARPSQDALAARAFSFTLPSTTSTRKLTSFTPSFFLIALACFSIAP
jgi:F-type H+-transporting ATPase subunit epsilon